MLRRDFLRRALGLVPVVWLGRILSRERTIWLRDGEALWVKTRRPHELCVVMQGKRAVHIEAEQPGEEGIEPGDPGRKEVKRNVAQRDATLSSG